MRPKSWPRQWPAFYASPLEKGVRQFDVWGKARSSAAALLWQVWLCHQTSESRESFWDNCQRYHISTNSKGWLGPFLNLVWFWIMIICYLHNACFQWFNFFISHTGGHILSDGKTAENWECWLEIEGTSILTEKSRILQKNEEIAAGVHIAYWQKRSCAENTIFSSFGLSTASLPFLIW